MCQEKKSIGEGWFPWWIEKRKIWVDWCLPQICSWLLHYTTAQGSTLLGENPHNSPLHTPLILGAVVQYTNCASSTVWLDSHSLCGKNLTPEWVALLMPALLDCAHLGSREVYIYVCVCVSLYKLYMHPVPQNSLSMKCLYESIFHKTNELLIHFVRGWTLCCAAVLGRLVCNVCLVDFNYFSVKQS